MTNKIKLSEGSEKLVCAVAVMFSQIDRSGFLKKRIIECLLICASFINDINVWLIKHELCNNVPVFFSPSMIFVRMFRLLHMCCFTSTVNC